VPLSKLGDDLSGDWLERPEHGSPGTRPDNPVSKDPVRFCYDRGFPGQQPLRPERALRGSHEAIYLRIKAIQSTERSSSCSLFATGAQVRLMP
jgi:hypothetical protein